MTYKSLFILFLLFLSYNIFAQVSGSFEKNPNTRYYVYLFENGQWNVCDSIVTNEQTYFKQDFPKGNLLFIKAYFIYDPVKVLKQRSPYNTVELLYDGDDTEFIFYYIDNKTYSKVLKGKSALKYYKLRLNLFTNDEIQYRIENLADLYSPTIYLNNGVENKKSTKIFIEQLEDEYRRVTIENNKVIDDLIGKESPNTLISKSSCLLKQHIIPSNLRGESRISWLREHFWDNINLKDTMLLRLSLFADRIKQFTYINQPRGLIPSQVMNESGRRTIKSVFQKLDANDSIMQKGILNIFRELSMNDENFSYLRQYVFVENKNEFLKKLYAEPDNE